MHAVETFQATPYNNITPVDQSLGYNNMPVTDATYPRRWPELEIAQTFYRSGGRVEGGGGNSTLTQETFSWGPRAPLQDSNNRFVSGLITGQLGVNMQQFDDFLADAGPSGPTLPFNINLQAPDGYSSASNASLFVPDQPVNQMYSLGQDHAARNSFALTSRPAPQPSTFPQAGQERDLITHDSGAADNAFTYIGLGGPVPVPDPVRLRNGQQPPVVRAQHVGANAVLTASFVCSWCGKRLCNRVGLKYERRAKPLFVLG